MMRLAVCGAGSSLSREVPSLGKGETGAESVLSLLIMRFRPDTNVEGLRTFSVGTLDWVGGMAFIMCMSPCKRQYRALRSSLAS